MYYALILNIARLRQFYDIPVSEAQLMLQAAIADRDDAKKTFDVLFLERMRRAVFAETLPLAIFDRNKISERYWDEETITKDEMFDWIVPLLREKGYAGIAIGPVSVTSWLHAIKNNQNHRSWRDARLTLSCLLNGLADAYAAMDFAETFTFQYPHRVLTELLNDFELDPRGYDKLLGTLWHNPVFRMDFKTAFALLEQQLFTSSNNLSDRIGWLCHFTEQENTPGLLVWTILNMPRNQKFNPTGWDVRNHRAIARNIELRGLRATLSAEELVRFINNSYKTLAKMEKGDADAVIDCYKAQMGLMANTGMTI